MQPILRLLLLALCVLGLTACLDPQQAEDPPVDACAAVTCAGHGTCDEVDATCACEEGYAGDDCSTCEVGFHRDATDACVVDASCATDDPCLNGACDDTGGVLTCDCDPGWDGEDCRACAAGWHDDGDGGCALDQECLGTSCSGDDAGACDDTDGVVTCTCNPGYSGEHCATCDVGFHVDATGACVVDADCATDDPCLHGACDDTGGVISCACEPGWDGVACDACDAGWHDDGNGGCALDQECLPNSCSGADAGVCDDTDGVVSCTCSPGYTGDACEACDVGFHVDATGTCVVDADCATDDPCVQGTCDDTGGVISCGCEPGWAGDTCDTCAAGFHDDGVGGCALNQECTTASCSGAAAGSCDDTGGVVSCTCNPGYAGDDCEVCDTGYHPDATGACAVDASCLTDNVCIQGACDDTGGVISCACEPGWAGATCEDCAAGWHDDTLGGCDLDWQCLDSTCSGADAGACDDTDGVIACTCNPGYTGDY